MRTFAAVAATGRLVAGARGGVGGDGEHQRVLDSPLRTAGGIEVLLVNARQLRYVPGRKSDMQDCQWIQLLHSCGLLRGSFRPHEIIVRVRTLHRQLSTLGAESTRFVQWMQKALDQMNGCGHRSDRSDGDGDRAGDCRRRTGAALRDERGNPARSLSSTSVATGARSRQVAALRHDRDCG